MHLSFCVCLCVRDLCAVIHRAGCPRDDGIVVVVVVVVVIKFISGAARCSAARVRAKFREVTRRRDGRKKEKQNVATIMFSVAPAGHIQHSRLL